MASNKDYYETLGIDKSASTQDVKSAFRKLAKKYHPDNKETGDEAKFKEISEAYQVLSDEQKKRLIVAYEPIWSIGTGIVPTNEEITEVLQFIKMFLPNNKILYGGSANEFFDCRRYPWYAGSCQGGPVL